MLATEPHQQHIEALRKNISTGRPSGSDDFVTRLEASLARILRPLVLGWHLLLGTRVAPTLGRAWPKLDALATMIELEIETYEQWLGQPELVSRSPSRHFTPVEQRRGWGKLQFVGTPAR